VADFAGRVALVTGGSGGIGSAICAMLVERGADIAFSYRSNRPDRLLQDLESDGRRVHAQQVDLEDETATNAFVGAAIAALGRIDVVVHAAGPHVPMVHLSRVSPANFTRQLNSDATAFFTLARAVLDELRRTRGNLVAVTTAATARYPVRDGLSAAPKGAVEATARGLAAEEGRYGVRVNCVGPGMLTDGMAERLISSGALDERALDATRENIPMRTFGTAGDIAEAVCFLASDRAKYISGQKLDVDGGYTV
jgi:NAD(P)-dependent dehydrogenase (short-subunit alcohol dehydrogenase family)